MLIDGCTPMMPIPRASLSSSCGLRVVGLPSGIDVGHLPADQRAELIEHWQAGAGPGGGPRVSAVTSSMSWNVTWSQDTVGPGTSSSPQLRRGGTAVGRKHRGRPTVIAAQVAGLVGQNGTALIVLNTRKRAKAVLTGQGPLR